MAKRASSTPDPEVVKLIERAGLGIALQLGDADAIFQIDGTPTATVKLKNGEYRKKPLFATQEFFFDHVYVGKRGLPILVFRPVDPQDYQFAEFDSSQVDEVMPLFAPTVAKLFGFEGEEIHEVLKGVCDGIIAADLAAKAEEERLKRIEQEALENEMAGNELWGRF